MLKCILNMRVFDLLVESVLAFCYCITFMGFDGGKSNNKHFNVHAINDRMSLNRRITTGFSQLVYLIMSLFTTERFCIEISVWDFMSRAFVMCAADARLLQIKGIHLIERSDKYIPS